MNASQNIKSIKSDTFFSKEKMRLVALVLLTLVSLAIMYLASTDPTSYYKNTFIYTFSILLFIFAVSAYFISAFDKKSKSFIFIFISVIIIVILAIVLTFKTGFDSIITNDYTTNTLLFCIVLIALAIFYFLFLENLVSRPGWTSFIIKFIFYIPCVFLDIIKYVLNDYSDTPKYIFYLFFVEFLLLLTYFYFYPRLQTSVYDNGVLLLKYPVELKKERRIDMELYKSFSNIKPLSGEKMNEKININTPIRQTYSISMWVYLNNQPFTQTSYTKETTIFAFLDASGNGHPKITYKNNERGIDQYVFYLGNYIDPSTNTYVPLTHTMTLPHQKWNNIVLNYRDLYVDFFINGVLVISKPLKERPNYSNKDIIIVGENGVNERSGLYGSICNVAYYKNILTKGQIADNYNLLSIRNPPVN
jgi:hypothetical protein